MDTNGDGKPDPGDTWNTVINGIPNMYGLVGTEANQLRAAFGNDHGLLLEVRLFVHAGAVPDVE